MFYIKDICQDTDDSEISNINLKTINDIFDNPPDDDKKRSLMKQRSSDQVFPREEIFVTGSTLIVNELNKIRDALVAKDGLVDAAL